MASEKVKVITLGCSKNVVDSEVLLGKLAANGWSLARDGEEVEIAVINTCGFIEEAKRESVETILHAVGLKKEGRLRKVVVMGCLSERYAAELQRELPDVDAFVGANNMDAVVHALGGDPKRELLGERMLTTPQHYAYLKISEGCDRPCSFCAIPLMRGQHVSKPMERIEREARRLAALGVKELILIAQDSTSYGLDLYGRRKLPALLKLLGGVEGIEWIRLMYAFPTGFPDELLEEFSSNPRLCRYLDIPLQHVADPVLSSMRRGITAEGQRRLLERIRSAVPGIALRTTLIVGYPTEGEREFSELVDFVGEAAFDRLGVFTYSQEEGTHAGPLGDPVPHELKEERRARIMDVQRGISLRKNRMLVGKPLDVLIDRTEGGDAFGRTERDAPEVDNEVIVQNARGVFPGSFCTVTVTDAEEYDLYGTCEEDSAQRAVGGNA